MRKYQDKSKKNKIRILALDDDSIMTFTLQSYFSASGFEVDVENNPYAAIEKIRNNHYDILMSDFLMSPICGDKVVEAVREFNNDIFIIFLTGHKSMAPPIKTIRTLNIQGYFEKGDNFSQLELLVESCVKSIQQLKTIREYKNDLEVTNTHLNEVNKKLLESHESLINALRSMVDARDVYTRGHSDRVSVLSEKISIAMGRSSGENDRVRTAGLLHDIGKLKIPDAILLKNGILTLDERNQMQWHPEYAIDILSNVEWFSDILPGVLQHHERYDGSGYPYRLSAGNIHEDARIICVADCFDAMTSFRRYRKNLTIQQARKELLKGKGMQFDPEIVDVFIKILGDFTQITNDPKWVDAVVDTTYSLSV